ncbi:hypothetical protein [Prosthecomicrobium sp. N25]|uniref:hypothetical protein n=1 Tax=Prosthecomicrobium sp. N25 TaxID=3129254 RepID=UPI0030769AC4
MRQHTMQFANFILRFGEKKFLLDYLDTVVIPAITSKKIVRRYGRKTKFKLVDTNIVRLESGDKPVFGVYGRLVKDTLLVRTQLLIEGDTLVKDESSMRSSPSSFFLLVINNHRLVYFPETPHAPDLKAFKATIQYFLDEEHRRYIRKLISTPIGAPFPRSVSEAYFENPAPTLEVVPLGGGKDLVEFLRQYKVLKKISLRVVRPNPELDGAEILGELVEYTKKLEADSSTLISESKGGLSVDAAIETAKDAIETGSVFVTTNGTDKLGNQLQGNNEKFIITRNLAAIPPDDSGTAAKMYDALKKLGDEQIVKVPSISLSKVNADFLEAQSLSE